MSDQKNEIDSNLLLRLNHELNSILTKTASLYLTFNYLLVTCCKIDGVDAGAMYLKDRFNDGLRLKSNLGISSEILENIKNYDFSSQESRLVMQGKPIYSTYPLQGKYIFSSSEMAREGFCYICLIPVSYDEEILGVINFYSKSIKDINHNLCLILEAFAMRVGAIIARVNAVLALRESEKRYKSLLETMSEGFLIIDKNFKITYGNNRICDMLGYQLDEILGLPVDYFFDEDNKEIFEKIIKMNDNRKRLSYEISWVKADGMSITTIVAPKAIMDKIGVYTGSFAVITDITALKEASIVLNKKELALREKTQSLNEVNTALKVLLKKREEDKADLENKVLANTQHLVLPILEKIKNRQLDKNHRALFEILESNIKNITSSFSKKLNSNQLILTATELEISNFIRSGKSSKEISEILNLSTRTIETHRFKIRKKLKINKNKVNLRTYLLSLQ